MRRHTNKVHYGHVFLCFVQKTKLDKQDICEQSTSVPSADRGAPSGRTCRGRRGAAVCSAQSGTAMKTSETSSHLLLHGWSGWHPHCEFWARLLSSPRLRRQINSFVFWSWRKGNMQRFRGWSLGGWLLNNAAEFPVSQWVSEPVTAGEP